MQNLGFAYGYYTYTYIYILKNGLVSFSMRH